MNQALQGSFWGKTNPETLVNHSQSGQIFPASTYAPD